MSQNLGERDIDVSFKDEDITTIFHKCISLSTCSRWRASEFDFILSYLISSLARFFEKIKWKKMRPNRQPDRGMHVYLMFLVPFNVKSIYTPELNQRKKQKERKKKATKSKRRHFYYAYYSIIHTKFWMVQNNMHVKWFERHETCAPRQSALNTKWKTKEHILSIILFFIWRAKKKRKTKWRTLTLSWLIVFIILFSFDACSCEIEIVFGWKGNKWLCNIPLSPTTIWVFVFRFVQTYINIYFAAVPWILCRESKNMKITFCSFSFAEQIRSLDANFFMSIKT